jgi:hypothetical protein
VATRPTNHRSIFSTGHGAVTALTSVWFAVVRIVDGRRGVFDRIRAQESDDALAEERRAHLFGTAHPHATSAK